MKVYIFSISLLLISCTAKETVQHQDAKHIAQEDRTAIEGLILGAFDDLWGAMDSTKILNYHTPDFYILENGEVWDNAKIISWMKRRLTNENRPTRINSMEYIDMLQYGESITCSYHNYAKFMEGDSLVAKGQWLESALAVQTPEGWKLKMMHSTWVEEKD